MTMSLNLGQQVFRRRELIPSYPDILWRIDQGLVRTLSWSQGTLITLGCWGLTGAIRASRPTITQLLKSFERAGLIQRCQYHIVLLSGSRRELAP